MSKMMWLLSSGDFNRLWSCESKSSCSIFVINIRIIICIDVIIVIVAVIWFSWTILWTVRIGTYRTSITNLHNQWVAKSESFFFFNFLILLCAPVNQIEAIGWSFARLNLDRVPTLFAMLLKQYSNHHGAHLQQPLSVLHLKAHQPFVCMDCISHRTDAEYSQHKLCKER